MNSSGGASLSDVVVVAVSSGFLTGDVFVGVGRTVRSGVDISRRGVVCTLSYVGPSRLSTDLPMLSDNNWAFNSGLPVVRIVTATGLLP